MFKICLYYDKLIFKKLSYFLLLTYYETVFFYTILRWLIVHDIS